MAKGTGSPRYLLPVLMFLLPWMSGCASRSEPTNLEHETATRAATPMIEAAEQGDLDRVMALSEAGESLNTLTEKGSPLMAAVSGGQDRVAWYLLSEGASPDLAAADGETPLMVASAKGSRRLVQLLLSAGARVNARDANGYTPVIRAAEQGHLSVVKVLLAAGANVNVSQGGESLLMKIVDSGDLLTAEMLLAAGADVNYRTDDGRTALDMARASNNRDLEMLLVQAGAQL
ncbi:ankyrin repeat domain-containing protein [Marinobacter sp. F4206]|uniref:ankyrin repeat domain-containing protein n=1 Tax=Marinobacter sp. F4206 TaxID=2861777 RepID=UPI001C5F7B27|nr:ankyrin repeat domain-containing protein [Marinobacter sp. F4206]MBW4934743.1 ankyrin repeat domain-containing protein [Marinobacter sp. F4206]